MIPDKIKEINWDNLSKNGFSNRLTHNIHPYFAKFPPEIPHNFIQHLTKKGDIVLDPFCGSGTTLVECKVLGRCGIGVDANPLACLISKVKTETINKIRINKINKIILKIQKDIELMYDKKNSSIGVIDIDFHNKDYWFDKNVQRELSVIKNNIQNVKDSSLRAILKLSFSRIIVKVSNQQSESRYKRVEKKNKDKDTLKLFVKHIDFLVSRLNELNSTKNDHHSINVHYGDTRKLNHILNKKVDLIVTSPPYLNSWDYGLYHKFRFKWLGLNVNEYENKEIGRHLRRNGNVIERYREDMSSCLLNFSKVLKKEKYCIIVNANSVVNGNIVNTSKIIIDEGIKHGLKFLTTIDKNVFGPHFGQRANGKSEDSEIKQKQEQIIIFQK